MVNKTKNGIPFAAIHEIFNYHSLGAVTNIKRLTGGKFNSVFKVETVNQKQYVIKIAPNMATRVLTYEQKLIKSEVYIYELMSKVKSVHFPKIYGYNWENTHPYKYLIMEFIDGVMLSKAKLSKEENNAVLFDLGCAMAEIHTIINQNGFGYIQTGFKATWKEAYCNMVENVIKDAISQKAKIPYLNKIKSLIKENDHVLDLVKTPSLVHFDLWPGNIIIKDNKLYALIDCERAMFGDITGDFISLDYAAPFDINKNRELIYGYNSVSKQNIFFNKEELIRLYLMKIYLGLICYVEAYYRLSKISPKFYSTRIFAKSMLKGSINAINKLNSSDI